MATRDVKRVRWSSVIVAGLTVAVLGLPFVVAGGADRLRDRHSDPRPDLTPPLMVAVAESGKLYHHPRCAFIHGPAVLQLQAMAVRRGFTPCPRCLGTLRVGTGGSEKMTISTVSPRFAAAIPNERRRWMWRGMAAPGCAGRLLGVRPGPVEK